MVYKTYSVLLEKYCSSWRRMSVRLTEQVDRNSSLTADRTYQPVKVKVKK